ncbi:hypothetical protein [Pontibacter rugosus]|uniref:Uncharacterized protein n=1 Tax=Pontibacter rugosus TaxID=1745966 RepID=A0ABW3SRT8_9BACT
MTENEFDILDELYFVTSYLDLKNTLSLPEEELLLGLQSLLQQGYVKILYPDQDTAHDYDADDFGQLYQDYFFLATKAGLVAHNSI